MYFVGKCLERADKMTLNIQHQEYLQTMRNPVCIYCACINLFSHLPGKKCSWNQAEWSFDFDVCKLRVTSKVCVHELRHAAD